MSERARVSRRAAAIAFVVALGVTCVLWSVRAQILSPIGPYLSAVSTDPKGELAFVLGGGRATRADLAAQLFHQGSVSQILISGVGGKADVDGVNLLSEQQILEGMLVALGVPQEDIVRLPDVVYSTSDEAEALRKYLEKHPKRSVVIVTTDYHTRRSRWIFEHALQGVSTRLEFAGATGVQARPADWWKNPDARVSYGMEVIKLIPAWWATLW